MLAGKCEDPQLLRYPLLASPKLDGVRALVKDGVVYSRNGLPIPNQLVQVRFGAYHGFDGELIVGEATAKDCYRQTMSGVMSADGKPNVRFHAFDRWDHQGVFEARYEVLRNRVARDPLILAVDHRWATSAEELLRLEQKWVGAGYEGVMIRDPSGPYKAGRSTSKEGWLLKLKRFDDSEAEVIGVTELLSNNNAAQLDPLGRTKRSSAKAGLRPTGMLGALTVKDTASGQVFDIGTGFDEKLRRELWLMRLELPLRVVKYKFFAGGDYEKPRFPVFIGFRDRIDL